MGWSPTRTMSCRAPRFLIRTGRLRMPDAPHFESMVMLSSLRISNFEGLLTGNCVHIVPPDAAGGSAQLSRSSAPGSISRR